MRIIARLAGMPALYGLEVLAAGAEGGCAQGERGAALASAADGAEASNGQEIGAAAKAAAAAGCELERATIKSVDMDGEMRDRAIRVAIEAVGGGDFASQAQRSPRDIAGAIKKEFDRLYGCSWHCIVGKSFGSYVTHGMRQSHPRTAEPCPPNARTHRDAMLYFLLPGQLGDHALQDGIAKARPDRPKSRMCHIPSSLIKTGKPCSRREQPCSERPHSLARRATGSSLRRCRPKSLAIPLLSDSPSRPTSPTVASKDWTFNEPQRLRPSSSCGPHSL